MPDWQVENVRLTVFVTPEFVVPPTLWRDCIGDEPETSTIQRAVATQIDTGSFANGSLALQVQPMRIDWRYEPAVPPTGPAVPQTLGPFPEAGHPLLELGRQWAERDTFPDSPRIALGLVLLSQTTDRMSGYQELAKFIDVGPVAPEASDFLYQINIARDARVDVPGLRINRLSKWSVALFGRVTLSFRPGQQTPDAVVADSQPAYQVRLELDINTQPGFTGLIPRDKVGAIINDLLEGAKEIAERGARQ